MQPEHRYKTSASMIRQRATPNRNMSIPMASKAKKQTDSEQNTPEAAEASSLDAAQQTIKTLMKLNNGSLLTTS